VRSGYTFKGWYTALSGGAPVSAATTVTADVTYYARWEAGAPAQFTVTFDANKGKISGKAKLVKSVTHKSKLGKLPAPKRAGYAFKGWYTAKSDGKKISANTEVTSNTTFYARWQIKSYKATFNANKGKLSGKSKLVRKLKYKSKLGKLKTPKRAGYKFKGWYTKKSGGKKIKSITKMPAKNVTYYAHWKKK
jgi:uncharacterized repeat protein (TIGR02543 family)